MTTKTTSALTLIANVQAKAADLPGTTFHQSEKVDGTSYRTSSLYLTQGSATGSRRPTFELARRTTSSSRPNAGAGKASGRPAFAVTSLSRLHVKDKNKGKQTTFQPKTYKTKEKIAFNIWGSAKHVDRDDLVIIGEGTKIAIRTTAAGRFYMEGTVHSVVDRRLMRRETFNSSARSERVEYSKDGFTLKPSHGPAVLQLHEAHDEDGSITEIARTCFEQPKTRMDLTHLFQYVEELAAAYGVPAGCPPSSFVAWRVGDAIASGLKFTFFRWECTFDMLVAAARDQMVTWSLWDALGAFACFRDLRNGVKVDKSKGRVPSSVQGWTECPITPEWAAVAVRFTNILGEKEFSRTHTVNEFSTHAGKRSAQRDVTHALKREGVFTDDERFCTANGPVTTVMSLDSNDLRTWAVDGNMVRTVTKERRGSFKPQHKVCGSSKAVSGATSVIHETREYAGHYDIVTAMHSKAATMRPLEYLVTSEPMNWMGIEVRFSAPKQDINFLTTTGETLKRKLRFTYSHDVVFSSSRGTFLAEINGDGVPRYTITSRELSPTCKVPVLRPGAKEAKYVPALFYITHTHYIIAKPTDGVEFLKYSLDASSYATYSRGWGPFQGEMGQTVIPAKLPLAIPLTRRRNSGRVLCPMDSFGCKGTCGCPCGRLLQSVTTSMSAGKPYSWKDVVANFARVMHLFPLTMPVALSTSEVFTGLLSFLPRLGRLQAFISVNAAPARLAPVSQVLTVEDELPVDDPPCDDPVSTSVEIYPVGDPLYQPEVVRHAEVEVKVEVHDVDLPTSTSVEIYPEGSEMDLYLKSL